MKPCVVESIPDEVYKELEKEWGTHDNHNSLDLMEQEQEDDQEHSNYQTAMFKALHARNQGPGCANDGWVPVAELHRLVSAKGNYPKATSQSHDAI